MALRSIGRGEKVCLRREGQQLAREGGGTFPGLADLLQIGEERIVRGDLIHGHLRMAQDDAEHVVEIVGDAAGEAADGFHLLGLEELILELGPFVFGLPAFGDVARHPQDHGDLSILVRDEGRDDLRRDEGSVAAGLLDFQRRDAP